MYSRIKEIRKKLSMTQQEFAEFLKVSKQNIVNYECRRRCPSDGMIQLICEKCGVNELWLRTGDGDMDSVQTEEDEIGKLIADIVKADPNSVKTKLIVAISKEMRKMNDDQVEITVNAIRNIINSV